MPEETWKDYPEFPQIYEISTFQRVRRKIGSTTTAGTKKSEGHILTPKKDWMGYIHFGLRVGGQKRVWRKRSRMMAITFIPPVKDKPLVNHKNGIKDDDRVENLEWCNRSENCRHSLDVLKNKKQIPPIHKGAAHPKARAILMYDFNGNFIKRYDTVAAAVREDISRRGADKVARGKQKTAGGYIWKYEKQN